MGHKKKDFYERMIEPHLEEIKNAVSGGATVKEISEALGISEASLYKYQNLSEELAEALTHGRKKIVINIKNALLKRALGYEYEEKKQYITEDKYGGKKKHTEVWTRHMPPSETASAMLLRNYDKTWLDKDNVSVELKQQELELRKAIAEANNFIELE